MTPEISQFILATIEGILPDCRKTFPSSGDLPPRKATRRGAERYRNRHPMSSPRLGCNALPSVKLGVLGRFRRRFLECLQIWYTGPTAIEQGALVVASNANLGLGMTIELAGGTLVTSASFSSPKGFASSTLIDGSVDTQGFNVTFSGPNTGRLVKQGSGMLTLTNSTQGSVRMKAGALALPNVTTGTILLQDNTTLLAAGTLATLTSLVITTPATLDICGAAAATLTTNSFSPGGRLRLNFGIGGGGSDLWAIGALSASLPTTSGAFQFEFQNLGGVATGVDYPLISFPSSVTPSASIFVFGPDMAAAGWAGAFTTGPGRISVRFASVPVPEPVPALIFVQGALLIAAAHYLSHRGLRRDARDKADFRVTRAAQM